MIILINLAPFYLSQRSLNQSSFFQGCDLPLKPYFWLATIQLILDVFRKEIMKFLFQFEPSGNRQQIPTRVIVYNLAYVSKYIMHASFLPIDFLSFAFPILLLLFSSHMR